MKESNFHFKQFYIPDRMRGGLLRYIEDGIKPGNFLTCIFRNDLVHSVGAADEENLDNIQAYANFLYNHAPGQCWGSKEIMDAWMESKRKEKKMKKPKYYLKPYWAAKKAYNAGDNFCGIPKTWWNKLRKQNTKPKGNIDFIWFTIQENNLTWNIPSCTLTKRLQMEEANES